MDTWARRGHVFLTAIFTVMACVYLLERVIFHVVVGPLGLVTGLVIGALMVGAAALIWRGHDWLRWPLGILFALNGLGTPAGLDDVFGSVLATLLGLFLLVAHIGCALALWCTPGIRAFVREQRARRKATARATANE